LFESGYNFQLVTINHCHADPNILKEFIYKFETTSGEKYLARIHQFKHHVYVVKFHLSKHKNLTYKYNFTLNRFSALITSKILRTLIDISLNILKKDEFASFAFVGVYKIPLESMHSNKIDVDAQTEFTQTECTQRFRIYTEIVERFLGSNTFIHNFAEKSNSYLLVNKRNPNSEELNQTIISMFTNIFQDLGDL
jgi:hypothetical protein